MNTLILVESPTKARTVAQHARDIYPRVQVRSTGGHLRDLPEDRLGVDVENGFAPQYEIRNPGVVLMLRPLIRQAGRVILATDPDREGEAIAWHITKVFAAEMEGKEVLRATFQSMTRESVHEGLRHPRALDRAQVQAAVARRVLDRLIGYHVSPRMWATLEGKDHGLGRVQAAALLLLEQHTSCWEVHFDL